MILIDSRGHGRSTRDERPFRYELMASDVLVVMNALHLEKVSLVGWSDGAVIELMVAERKSTARCGCIFLCLQYGPKRGKGDDRT